MSNDKAEAADRYVLHLEGLTIAEVRERRPFVKQV